MQVTPRILEPAAVRPTRLKKCSPLFAALVCASFALRLGSTTASATAPGRRASPAN